MRRILSYFVVPCLTLLVSASLIASPASASAAALPSVRGGFNRVPSITFPSSAPPTTLKVDYLHRGTGPSVKAGELLVANYLGQIWRGKVFDSSFSRKQLSSFPIGVGAVIPGWDRGLVGVPLGSRVMLVVPPADGYGASGDPSVGIKAKDTLVFIVDLVSSYSKGNLAQPNPRLLRNSVDGISITTNSNKQPTVTISKKASPPSSVKFTEIASGNGHKITSGLVVMQLLQVGWSGNIIASTWKLGSPFGANIAVAGQPGIFDKLVGLNVGSRILLELPKITTGGPYAVVAEVVAEPHDGAA